LRTSTRDPPGPPVTATPRRCTVVALGLTCAIPRADARANRGEVEGWESQSLGLWPLLGD